MTNKKLIETETQKETRRLYEWYFNNYINIASNLFKYKGLEFFGDDLTSEIVERGYIFNGVNVAFKDKMLGAYCLPAVASAKLNVYGIPKEYIAVGYNGKTWNLDNTNAVLLRNNGTFSPDVPLISYYCSRIVDCDMAIKVNVNSNKMPISFICDPDQLLTVKNMYQKITGNEPVVYAPKKIKTAICEPTKLEAIKTGAEFLADKLNDTKQDYISALLTYLGLDNVSVEKRERLNTTEAGANDEHIKSNLYLKLKCRQEDWKKVNAMLGCNVSVEINYDFIENLKYAEESIQRSENNE